jgi:hypothetical protein
MDHGAGCLDTLRREWTIASGVIAYYCAEIIIASIRAPPLRGGPARGSQESRSSGTNLISSPASLADLYDQHDRIAELPAQEDH